MTFLPEDYEVPVTGSAYTKLKQGDNRLRILSSPIIGFEWWIEDGKKRKPSRCPMNTPIPVEYAEEAKHFWAMSVWNYETGRVEILEITQKGIQKALRSLTKDTDWGSPLNYDIVITRSGEGLETEYVVVPKPAKEVDPAIKEQFENMHINLEALYTGEDPFNTALATEPEIDIETLNV